MRRLRVALAWLTLTSAFACGSPEKDCWRGYKQGDIGEPPRKDKMFCEDCCKVCGSNSKACGDSCISESFNCNVGEGCACNRL